MTTGYVTSNLLPLESVKLGRLVLDAKRPQKDFFDPFDSGPTASEVARSEQRDFQETEILEKVHHWILHYAISHGLLNPAAWFNKACTQEPTRRFLESAIDDASNIYLIIGFRTVQDINPVDEPNREIVKEENLGNELKSSVPDEQVFVIIYHKVRFNWLSNMYVDNMTMEKSNRWVSCWAWRGAYENENKSEDDILEAELTDLGDLDSSDQEIGSGIEVVDFTDNPSSAPSIRGTA